MKSSLRLKYKTGKYNLQKEGLIPFIKQGFSFLAWCFFRYQTFYLYEMTLNEASEVEPAPRIQNFTFEIISTKQQVDDLVAEGFDFGSYSNLHTFRKRLNAGAVAFCIFVGKELASVDYVAMTEQAKNSLTQLPQAVDFLNNETYSGPSETKRKYRRMGFHDYRVSQLSLFLRQRGKTVDRYAIDKSNVAAQKAMAKFAPRIYAEGRYLKLLWWKSRKEKPIGQAKEC